MQQSRSALDGATAMFSYMVAGLSAIYAMPTISIQARRFVYGDLRAVFQPETADIWAWVFVGLTVGACFFGISAAIQGFLKVLIRGSKRSSRGGPYVR